MKKRNIDIRVKTLNEARKVLMFLYNNLKKHENDYAPEKDVWYVTNFNDDTMGHTVKPANIHYKRYQITLRFLKSYGLIDRKIIDGVRCVKWTGNEPDDKMIHDICTVLNKQKNHRDEIGTTGNGSQPFHQTEIDFEAVVGPDTGLTDSEKIDLILEKVEKIEKVLAVLNGSPIQ
jgi:hypothetical protein